MTNDQNDTLLALANLLFITQQDKIEWRPVSHDALSKNNHDELISFAFATKYNDNKLRIFKRKYKTTRVVQIRSLLQPFTIEDMVDPKTETVWRNTVVLEILDKNNNSIWQFPEEDILSDLLEAVKYKVSGAQDVINSLISEKLETDDK